MNFRFRSITRHRNHAPLPRALELLNSTDSATLLEKTSSRHAEVSLYRIQTLEGAQRVAVKTIHNRDLASSESLQHEYAALQEVKQILGSRLAGTFPNPLLLLLEEGTICFGAVPGIPLERALYRDANVVTGPLHSKGLGNLGRRIGKWLEIFHLSTRVHDQRHNCGAYKDEFDRTTQRCEPFGLSKSVLDSVSEEAGRLNESLDGFLTLTAAVHGDFIPQNILIGNDSLGVIDFASYRRIAPAYLDLAHFLAYLMILSTKPVYSRTALESLSNHFLAGYSLQLNSRVLQLYIVLALLRIIADGIPSVRSKHWSRRIERLLVRSVTEDLNTRFQIPAASSI